MPKSCQTSSSCSKTSHWQFQAQLDGFCTTRICMAIHPKNECSNKTLLYAPYYFSVKPAPMKIRGRKKPININNFAGLSRKWVGVKLFMCFPVSWGKRETHKQNSQEISGKGRESPGIIPGQSRENFVYVFACLLVFPCPKK